MRKIWIEEPGIVSRCLGTVPHNDEQIESILKDAFGNALEAPGKSGPGRPGEPIIVMDIYDNDEMMRYTEEQGRAAVTVGQEFSSAPAFSEHLGFKGNSAYNALVKAEAEGEFDARLRGVVFRYSKNLRE